ncbi:MAG: hypothetical protein M3Y81_28495 [Chloroflexota bacterium]|nr:hypothetical protein [Chloroflexota bacterium]
MSDNNELPIACKLSEHELVLRRQEVDESVFQNAEKVEELADGYAFKYTYDAAIVAKLADFIAVERRCCPFFTFELIFEQGEGPLWLRLRGGEGVKEFIRDGLNAPGRMV